MTKTINDLYDQQAKFWNEQNEYYFGVSSLKEWNDKETVERHLNECVDKFWNNGTNRMKKLFEDGRCNDIDKLIPGSYELVFDFASGIIVLYGSFRFEEDDRVLNKTIEKTLRSPILYLPYANDLCWFINNTEYVLRISANRNYSLIVNTGSVCRYQRTWTYDASSKTFDIKTEGFDPYENLTKINRTFLETIIGKELTKDNFEEALSAIPEFDNNSLIYFRFDHLSDIFNMISKSKRFANPIRKAPVPINVIKILSSQRVFDNSNDNGSFNNLVLSKNTLFALENSRTIIYKSEFNRSFNFTDCDKLLDAFKTSTNKSAGRSRLILDDVEVGDGMLWRIVGNKKANMFDLVLNDIETIQNLSVLSRSPFSMNNDAKRIMMTAKLRAQAVVTKGEIDNFTHETPARIVFGDFEGFNYGDSIIVSRSFARKLESSVTLKERISSQEDYALLATKYNIGDNLGIADYNSIIGSTMHANYRDIELVALTRDYFVINARIPFSVGDKITNLHGSKGIVSLILEDDQMPMLKEDIVDPISGVVFKAGPFEVIVSALSVYRRKSLGQLFEAWSTASGNLDVNNIEEAVEKYGESMKKFSEKSIVVWNGKESIKPIGVNAFIRLDHNAVSKQSHSYLRTNYGRMLKFGEMELLNLASRGLYEIMNEIDIRSVSKHQNPFAQIREMQSTGHIDHEPANNLRFFNILYTIGFDFNLRNMGEFRSGDEFDRFMISDSQVDLFTSKN